MTREQKINMILDILGTADYDLAKSYKKDTAEDPELVDEYIQELIDLVDGHLDA